jgi:RND family efflux transporter MFP subunit
MSTSSSGIHHSLPPTTTPRRGMSFGWLVTLLAVLALGGWCTVRIRTALQERSALAAEREQVARTAQKKAGVAVTVEAVRGVPTEWQPAVPIDGTLMPRREADLGFKTPGRLASIRVHVGDYVREGTLLASLEQAEASAQVEAAAAQVRAAEAQMALSEDSAHRMGTLANAGAATESSVVQTRQQHALATAQAESARAQLLLARASLGNHTLMAPFAGFVTKVPSGPGMIVSPGVTLFHLQDTKALRFVGTVGETDAPLVRRGTTVELQIDGRTVRGRVTAVLVSVDAATRRVPIEAELQNEGDRPILAGTFVRGTIRGDEKAQVLRLPASVIRPGSQDEVLAVERDGNGGSARLHVRHVRFVSGPEGTILVRAGLQPTEEVLRMPTTESREADTVMLAQAGAQ